MLENQIFESSHRDIIVSDAFDVFSDAIVFEGDCRDILSVMPSDSVDLIITSPPYNIGKKYEMRTSLESYLANQEVVIRDLIRVLSPTGSICWQVGNYINKGEVYPLDIYFAEISQSFEV